LTTVCDLERVFGGLADRLPRDDDEEFTLTPESVPAVTGELAADSVGLTWFLHHYNDMPVDLVAMYWAAAVGVNDHGAGRLPAGDRGAECRVGQVGGHPAVDGVAHDLA